MRGVKALFDLLRDLRLQDVQFAMNGGEARRRLAEKEYDLAVVNTPLRDEFGTDLACRIAETTAAGVALLVKADRVAEVNAQAESSGVFVLGKPLSRSMFQYTMRMMGTMERRLQLLKGENARLQQADRGDPPGGPGEAGADRVSEDERGKRPPLYRAPGHEHALHQGGDRPKHHPYL